MPLRLGEYTFHNCDPLRWGLARTDPPVRATTVDTPDRITAALLAGELDVAPISLVEYLRHNETLLALPNMAIGCDGPVLSCVLASRRALTELDGRPVALCTTSRTAVTLATVLLRETVGVRPRYRPAPPVLRELLRVADAGVLIGDPALRATYRPEPGVDLHDLGRLWWAWTGLPMVFAVWAVRRPVAAHAPADVAALHRALLDAAYAGLAHADTVAAGNAPESVFTQQELAGYYRTLDYTLGTRQLAGITHFAKLAGEHAELALFAGEPVGR